MSASKTVKKAVRFFSYGVPTLLLVWVAFLAAYSTILDHDGWRDNDEYARAVGDSGERYFWTGVAILLAVLIARHPKASLELVCKMGRDARNEWNGFIRSLKNNEHPLP